VPYTLYLLATLVARICAVGEPYSWARVHDPAFFNTIIRTPMFGEVTVDRWGEIATGYVLFFVFGTGADAWKLYKSMAVKCGLGRGFPSLYAVREGGSGAQTRTGSATWTDSVTSRAKSVFMSRNGSVATTTTRSESVGTANLSNTSMKVPILNANDIATKPTSTRSSVFSRILNRQNGPLLVLPVFTQRSHFTTDTSSRDWAVRDGAGDAALSPKTSSKSEGIRVFWEIRFGSQDAKMGKERKSLEV
jgi:pheromone a factor receptor